MKSRKQLILTLLIICMSLFFCASALASGVETDEDGGVWNYDAGTYTDPDGNVHQITQDGVPEDSGSGSGTVQNDDGSITVVTGEQDPVQNADGSIEVQSGQGGTPSADPTRAPLEGDAWQAVLDRAAARNGKDTPTAWTDPATGSAYEVGVVYMGLGRSMIRLDGQEMLVNTVDLKWQTEAPEDKVLAIITPKNSGYCWLYEKPNKKITTAKLDQCRRDKVVRVIGTGKTWTLIDYDGMRGYVRTAALEFCYNDHVDFESGVVSVKGRTKGKDTAWIYYRAGKHGVIEEYRIGTPLTLFDVLEQWAEVDICGRHCYIKSDHFTLEKEIASSD